MEADIYESDIDSVSNPEEFADVSGYEDADGFDDEPPAICIAGHDVTTGKCPICRVDAAVGLQTTDTIPNKLNMYNYTCMRGHDNLFGVRGADCRACEYEDTHRGRAWAVRESDPIRFACVCKIVQYVVPGTTCENKHRLPQNIPYGVINLRAYIRSIMEYLYHQRFDSIAPIPLTAYCSRLKIVVTCAMDEESMSSYPGRWARENGCKHVHLAGSTLRSDLLMQIANACQISTQKIIEDYNDRAGICAYVDLSSIPTITTLAHKSDREPLPGKSVRRCREFNANGELRRFEKSHAVALPKLIATQSVSMLAPAQSSEHTTMPQQSYSLL
jgi:hypothetical protein